LSPGARNIGNRFAVGYDLSNTSSQARRVRFGTSLFAAAKEPNMAKKKKEINKTRLILQYIESHPDVSNKEVAEALGKKGIVVTRGYVAFIKHKAKVIRQSQERMAAKLAAAAEAGANNR
jgi:hypothetical protein